jgi:hypothetical protein
MREAGHTVKPVFRRSRRVSAPRRTTRAAACFYDWADPWLTGQKRLSEPVRPRAVGSPKRRVAAGPGTAQIPLQKSLNLSYLASTGAAQLYTLNLSSAVATPVGAGFTLQSGISNGRFGFDFNPSVDGIRAIGGSTGTAATSGANYRLNPITGAIAFTDTNAAFAAGDTNVGTTLLVAGLAYSNNVAGSPLTTLYGYECNTDSFVTVGNVNGSPNSPNSGLLFTVGLSGLVSNTASLDLDIRGATGIACGNLDTAASANDDLYTFNLNTGAATLVGQIGTGIAVLDIAVQVVPGPGTCVMIGGALAALTLARGWRSVRRRVTVA